VTPRFERAARELLVQRAKLHRELAK